MKPKLMHMILLGGKRQKPRPSRPRRPAKNPHARLKEGGELEKNPGSDREITPEFTTDRPASHTLTHLTQRILIYIYHMRSPRDPD